MTRAGCCARILQMQRSEMSTRTEIVTGIYNQYDEAARLGKTRHGQLEYAVTMNYIGRYLSEQSSIIEIGAGTGRYSIALAKAGHNVTAVELVEKNLEILRENSRGIDNLKAYQGDATDLGLLGDDSFDITLVFGPMYHLYEPDEIGKAIDEAVRITKPGGVLLFAFLSVFAIMYSNYLYGNWAEGEPENFTDDYQIKHFKEQMFTGYDVSEFEELFKDKPVEWLATTGVDGMLEPLELRPDFELSDEDFEAFMAWFLQFSEKRDLLGTNSHLLYICRKKRSDFCEK